MALPKTHRLKERRQFNAVYQRGIRRNSAHLTLRALRAIASPSGDAPPLRIGISISRKVSKHAVVRNRMKRRIRAALRTLLPRSKSGWLVVIVVKSQAIQCDYWQFLQELEQLLVEAEVLHGD